MNESAVEALLKQLIERMEKLEEGTSSKKKPNLKKSDKAPLTKEDLEAIDNEIDFEWWFEKYGESPHPARFMNQQNLPYNREETLYLFNRMKKLSPQKVNGGTHQFKYVGRTYCKTSKNTVNCFACIPVP